MKKRKILFVLLSCLLCLVAGAGPDNIAGEAKVTASTSLNQRFLPENITDGMIGVNGQGEWACTGVTTDWGYIRFPWVRMDWDRPRKISRIVLYDRPSLDEHIAGGKLVFSDGSVIWVNQIPNDGTGKTIQFEPKTVNWVTFVSTDGNGCDLGFSEIEVYPAFPEFMDYVATADPYIETNRGRYIFFITGARPFGMVGTAPLTRNKNQNGGGYNYNESEILGFPQIHTWMISGIEVMPAPYAVDPRKGQQGWKSKYSHDDEIVQPGYQRVFLREHKVWTELTATERVTFHRFRFTEDMKARIITNLGGYVSNSTMKNARVRKISEQEFEGSFTSADRYWGGPREVEIFFVAQFDKAFKSLEGWKGQQLFPDVSELSGDSSGVSAIFPVKAGTEIQMKIAVSYTSIANARKNLEAECAGWNFDGVRADSRRIWNEAMGRIKAEGGTEQQQVKFYTDLWHVLLGRQMIDDVSGDYPDRTQGKKEGTFTDAVFKVKTLPKGEDGKSKFHMYNTDALWLTQWNLNVLWGLAWPEIMDEMSASMIRYAENGYLLPRGPCGGGYSYIMTGCPATNLIVSTYMKGLLTKADAETAFRVMKQNHLPGGMLGPSSDIEFYTRNGYWPGNAGITVEAAFQDYALAQMAKSLGKKADYRFFLGRSQGWKKLFEPEKKLLFPKDRQGQFIHRDPLSGQGWVEANAWQATWSVSHDIEGLAKLMGGYDTLCARLNFAFEKARASDFVFAYNEGYVSYANQPGCSNAHVFNYAGKPWLSQYWVRRVKEQAYGGTTPDLGYGGHDEDQGQMGGVSALMAIGLFNLQGNVNPDPVYDLTTPVFDKITITLDQRYYTGKTFVIETIHNVPGNDYIQQALLNGRPLSQPWFRHKDFAAGGTLTLTLGKDPLKQEPY